MAEIAKMETSFKQGGVSMPVFGIQSSKFFAPHHNTPRRLYRFTSPIPRRALDPVSEQIAS